MSKLTAKAILHIHAEANKKKANASEFKKYGRSIMNEYGISQLEALDLLAGRHQLEILSLYEE